MLDELSACWPYSPYRYGYVEEVELYFFSYLLTVLLLLYSIAYSVMGLQKESKLLFWLPLDILKTVFLDGLKRAGSQNE